jgi:hypothetical protein
MNPGKEFPVRFSLKILTIAFGAATAFAGAVTLPVSPASAQGASCPCNFTLSARQMKRKFYGCSSTAFPQEPEKWDGTRSLHVFKSAKGGKEYGAIDRSFQITDRVGTPNTHICGTYSRWPKQGGVARNIIESTIETAVQWDACLSDLSTLALTVADGTNDPSLTCDPSDPLGYPYRLQYLANQTLLELPTSEAF